MHERAGEPWRGMLVAVVEVAGARALGRFVRRDDTRLTVVFHHGAASQAVADALCAPPPADSFSARMWQGCAAVAIDDAATRPGWNDAGEFWCGQRSYLGVPVMQPDGGMYGLIELFHPEPAAFVPVQRKLVEQCARMIEAGLGLPQGDAPVQAAREEDLRVSEERFRLLVEHSGDDFFLHDDRGRFLDVNERACLSTGFTREELLSMRVVDLSLDLDQDEKEEIWRSTAPGTAVTVYSHHRRKDASTFPVEVRISCHLIHGQKVFMGLVRDITERVEAEAAVQRLNAELEQRVAERTQQLRETSEMLQAVMDNATDAIFLKDADGRFLLFNRAAERYTGTSADEVIGRTAGEVFGAEAGRLAETHERAVMRTGRAQTVEEVLSVDGMSRTLLATRSPHRDSDNRIVGLVGISRDVTERKAIDEELKAQRERLMLATQVSGIGIWDFDIAAQSLYCDPRWYEIMGLDPAQPLQTIDDFKRYIHPDDVERATEVRMETLSDLVANRENYSIVFRIVRPSGEIRWLRSAACLIAGGGEVPRRAVGVVADITESHLAEEELQRSYALLEQAERLARIGSWTLDLASGEFACSAMMYEMNGADPNGPPITGDELAKLLTPDGFRRTQAAIRQCILTGEPYTIDTDHFRPDGTRFAVHIRGQANRDAQGRVVTVSGTVQDVSEREEARAQLMALADNLPSGAIFRAEPNAATGRYALTYCSAGIEGLMGISADELIAHPQVMTQALHDDDRPHYFAAFEHSMRHLRVFDCRFRIRKPDGRLAWMHARSAPRTQPDGKVVWDGIVRDITPEHEAEEALEKAKAAAERAEKAKSDFLAIMSHEIRTPMNVVIGMTRLMLKTDLSSKQRNYLEKINASAKTLLAIINDILDFSKIEAGGLELESIEFALDTVLDAVSTFVSLRAEEKGIEIAYAVAPEVPRRLMGDPLRLSQVLTNLVGNAVKFTARGEVVVSIAVGAEPGMLAFSVRDTGIGLDAAQIAGLFVPFAQADSGTSRRYGGTGLGLSICKQIVEKMGGGIHVESVPAQGSTFHFTMPLKPAGAPSSEDRRPSPSHAIAGRRAIVIDDNASVRDILADMLGVLGLRVETAESGPAALAALHAASQGRDPFDLVLVDWRMPGMDGLETARRIRADGDLRQPPAILMVTAYSREEVVRQGDLGSVHGFLVKPVTESLLFDALLNLFSPYQVDPAGQRRGAAASASVVPERIRRALCARRILLVDDNALNREVVSDLLAELDVIVDAAASGAEALERLVQARYDAVLLDMQMPDMNGLEVARRIRLNPAWKSLPVIALTAQARPEDREASLRAGMNAHLAKPIDEMLLYETLDGIFAARDDDAASAAPRPGASSATPAAQEPAALKEARRLDRLLRGFLRDFSDLPERMQTALGAADHDDVAALAHGVKGAAGYLRATALADSAQALEKAARSGESLAIGLRAPVFDRDLRSLLASVRRQLDGDAPVVRHALPVDLAQVLPLIAEVEPVIACGDYAATAMLERLARLLEGGAHAPLLESVRVHYEDLELDTAQAALSALKAALGMAPQREIRA